MLRRVPNLLLDVDGVLIQAPRMFSQHLREKYGPRSLFLLYETLLSRQNELHTLLVHFR